MALNEYNKLLAQEAEIRKKRIRLLRRKGYTYRQIGEKLGISFQRVRQLLEKN